METHPIVSPATFATPSGPFAKTPLLLLAIFAWLSVSALPRSSSASSTTCFPRASLQRLDRSVVFEICNTASVGGTKGRVYFSPRNSAPSANRIMFFEDMIAHGVVAGSFMNDGKSTRVLGRRAETVTTYTLTIWACPPLLGRTIRRKMAALVRRQCFVMSYRLWQREFAGDPQDSWQSFICAVLLWRLSGSCPHDSTLLVRAFDAHESGQG